MFYQRGDNLEIPRSLFRENRQRLCESLKNNGAPKNSFVLLEGGKQIPNYDADTSVDFRQEPYFHWCFGVRNPDYFGAIDVDSQRAILFMPRLPPSYVIWLGRIAPPQEIQETFEADAAYYSDEMSTILSQLKPSVLLLLKGLNTDSGVSTKPAEFTGIDNFKLDYELLHPLIAECRVFKSVKELEVIRYACKVSVDAHKEVMRVAKPGLYHYQLESTFRHFSFYKGGCAHVGYSCICAIGENAAVLHHGHGAETEDRLLTDGDICLLDMGAEYCGYTADITISFPANGKFNEQQKMIYNAVYNSSQAVFAAAKPGVSWLDMHKLSMRKVLEGLLAGGLLVGNVDEMMAARLGGIFMPHGLGHFMGLDVHDPNGYPMGGVERPKESDLKSLRTARTLLPGMVLTIEPGCYFIGTLLDAALNDPIQSKFLVKEQLDRCRNFGGVRIEDDILITETGCENLSAGLPRTIAEIEEFMKHRT